ncbi:unnamed protein product [Didymodactylos carnosus]|uniref:Uncharacterized protein n=1 Tax=Didymodactylos carnosus TaxID=1234261 RepID=A0A815RPT2_9BILA|nr:unnamed protein product [Didymodactylos carnosus]CAF1480611.1 unnamed protein product [Didymodactylos carnosus]CAF3965620.1 unnamed protein product [Didymodactylos carnosus]CAF4345768.1 unnamed protein product [Didymodactylos carnosus]
MIKACIDNKVHTMAQVGWNYMFLVVIVLLNMLLLTNGTLFCTIMATSNKAPVAINCCHFVDLNGDGLTDILVSCSYSEEGNGRRHYAEILNRKDTGFCVQTANDAFIQSGNSKLPKC